MLTQLSSICVLEFLSFEKRLYIVSQIPDFRNVEKSLPLHLDYLNISTSKIRINQYEYYLEARRSQGFKRRWTFELRKIRRDQNPSIGTVLGLVNNENVIFNLIGNRPIIYTKKLEFRDSWDHLLYIVPIIQAEIIEIGWFPLSNVDLDQISNIMGPKPLKKFSTELWSFEILTHPIVQNSEKLVLRPGGEDFDPQRMNHSHIHLKGYDRYSLMFNE